MNSIYVAETGNAAS